MNELAEESESAEVKQKVQIDSAMQLDLNDLDAIRGGSSKHPTCGFWCSGHWTFAAEITIW